MTKTSRPIKYFLIWRPALKEKDSEKANKGVLHRLGIGYFINVATLLDKIIQNHSIGIINFFKDNLREVFVCKKNPGLTFFVVFYHIFKNLDFIRV